MPPRCLACDGLARPAVVWFGEALPENALAAAISACECDIFLSVGTSSVVYPAAGLLQHARSRGAFTVEINTDVTPATAAVDVALVGPAGDVLASIDVT
jgi:NAD-dependent deacetylase